MAAMEGDDRVPPDSAISGERAVCIRPKYSADVDEQRSRRPPSAAQSVLGHGDDCWRNDG